MFKNLQWKLISSFLLIVLSVTCLSGGYILFRTYTQYYTSFTDDMNRLFTPEYLHSVTEITKQNPSYLSESLRANRTRMGIDASRNYFVIDTNSSTVEDATKSVYNSSFTDSKNYLTALTGRIGNENDFQKHSLDYAVPVNLSDTTKIIYITDDLSNLKHQMISVGIIFGEAAFLGVLLAVIFGMILAKKIAEPINALARRAKNIRDGNFDSRFDSKTGSKEILRLNEAFNEMSAKLSGTLSDISTEKSKIEAILQNMTDGVMAFDTNGKVIHINATARKMLNIEDIDHYRFDKLFSILGVKLLIGDLLYLGDKRSCERDAEYKKLAMKINFAVIEDQRNRTVGVLAVFHDITKQQKLEASRREFVANVSHELRTPLTTVKSYAETLLDFVKDNKTAASFTNTILNETDRMTRLVKDLLVLSSLENTASLNKSWFSMQNMVNDVVGTMSLVATEKGHRLHFKQSSPIPDYFGDRDKLEQVLYNIISNSIKYTPNGGKIDVQIGKLYKEIYIEVRDNGIGIPEKDLSRIFERFYRVDKARSRELGGTGLGLAISKSIVDSHGGTIEIKSRQHEGTRVIISLPIKS